MKEQERKGGKPRRSAKTRQHKSDPISWIMGRDEGGVGEGGDGGGVVVELFLEQPGQPRRRDHKE
jgi:hypothetical protein